MSPSSDVSTGDATGGFGQSLGHAWLITRMELRRSYRHMVDNPRQFVGIAISGLLLLLFAPIAVWGAYSFGTALGTDAFVEQLSIARMAIAAAAASVTFIVALATVQEYGKLEESEVILTAIPPHEAVWGLLLSSYVTFAGPTALPILAVGIAFAVGAGSLASAPVIVLVLLGTMAFSTTAGFVLGQAVRTIGARVAFVARYKTVIGVFAFIAYFAIITTGVAKDLFKPILTVLESTPFGWFVDLALVAAPAPSIGAARPVAAALFLLAGTTLSVWLAVKLSGALWYTDPVQPASEYDPTGTKTATDTRPDTLSAGVTDRLFGGYVPLPILRIAQKSWRRTYRAPMKLQYAVFPAFFMVQPIQQSYQSGEVSMVLPTSIAIYGAWATGAAFTLNPLGDEGSVLPITLISGVAGRRLLGGLVFAGIVAGGPPTVLLAGGLGLVSPLGAFPTLATAALGGVLCVGACAIGASVGTAFPKFEHTRISRSRKAIIPGFSAFVVYSLVLLVISLPGLLGGIPLVADWLAQQTGVSAQSITLAGLATTTLLAGMTAWIGLRSAIKTINGYTPAR